MQLCKNCGAKQLDGTIFCTECGASFIEIKHPRDTTASLRLRDNIDLPDEPRVVPAPDIQPTGSTMSLVVLNSGRRLNLDVSSEVLIGRADARHGFTPDVDLGRDGGYDAGVSRNHARLALKDGVCTLEDIGSSNGTFVNGRRLLPNQPIPIHNGDELKFGTLLLRVEFSV